MMLVNALGGRLPQRYIAEPQVHLGSSIEIDVATYEDDETEPTVAGESADGYEVRVYDTRRGRRLVADIEIVSPANKDRTEHRRAFVSKCHALLQERVSVVIVDLVTTRSSNLYGELMESIGHADPSLGVDPPPLYAVACRFLKGEGRLLEIWAHPLTIGQPLPTLPLWIAPDFMVPLELEASYEETCRVLRIP